MPKAVSGYHPNNVKGGTLAASVVAANAVQGAFVGHDSTGAVRLGDFRAAQGPIIVLGVLLQDVVQKDPKGNALFTGSQVSYVGDNNVKVSGMVDVAGAALTPGKLYYASSGGAVTGTKPAATTNDIDQAVGVAVSASELQLLLGQPIVHA